MCVFLLLFRSKKDKKAKKRKHEETDDDKEDVMRHGELALLFYASFSTTESVNMIVSRQVVGGHVTSSRKSQESLQLKWAECLTLNRWTTVYLLSALRMKLVLDHPRLILLPLRAYCHS